MIVCGNPVAGAPPGAMSSPVPESDFVLSIGGSDFSKFYSFSSLHFVSELNARSSLELRLVSGAGELVISRLSPGALVLVKIGGARIFFGSIEERVVESPGTSFAQIVTLTCVDRNQVTDRFYVARSFDVAGQSSGSIIRSIVENELGSERVTTEFVEDGVVVSNLRFNYRTVAQAFDTIATLNSGVFSWYIDMFSRLHFFSPVSNIASWHITDSSAPVIDLSYRSTRQDLRNVQIVRAGRDITESRTETFSGDGETQTFDVAFQIAEEPIVTADTGGGPVAQEMGLKGAQTGKDFYWSKNERTISQEKDDTPLATSAVLSVTYKGLYPVTIVKTDADSILERQAIEGGSGLYQDVFIDSQIENQNIAVEKAVGLLERFSSLHDVVEYSTDRGDINVGQLQHIERAEYGLNDEFLIMGVQLSDIGGGNFRTVVTAINSGRFDSWIDFFRFILSQSQEAVDAPNEQISTAPQFSDTVQSSDVLVVDLVDNVNPYPDDPYSVFLVGEAKVSKALHRMPQKI